jgi:hypothetical protein
MSLVTKGRITGQRLGLGVKMEPSKGTENRLKSVWEGSE